jgi:hypothetical protein
MRKHGICTTCLLALFAVAACMPLRAQHEEQGKPPIYTYVAQWAVPRAQWGDMTKLAEQDRPLMDKLIADSTIIGYGEFANVIHHEGEPTHGNWFTASSQGNLMKALEALYARPGLTAPVLAASKHWDYLLVSRTHNARSGKFDGGYLTGIAWDVKPGQDHAFQELMTSRLVPAFEKLLTDGVVVSYSLDSEDYHTDKPGRVTFVFTTADAEGLDKVDQALQAEFRKDKDIGPALQSLTDGESHRDFLLHVSHMTFK